MSNHHQAYQRTPRGSRSGRSSIRHEDEAPGENLLIGGDKIPFVDSADEEEDSSAGGSRGTIGNGDSSGNSSDSEDGDVMTESQENLALAYVNRYRMPSLAERRNQDKLTVTIEHERKPTADARKKEFTEEAKDQPTDLKARQERAVGLRRNSISMPTLTAEDLDALHQSRIDEEESSIMIAEEQSVCSDSTVTPQTPTSAISLKPMLHYDDASDEDEEEEPPKPTK
uniref:(northern house mosquito) hypothetical protein n=1 Tax=Culex pipiens TaxID=7175 RepID=A0A8D8PBP7_CULPI